MDSYQQAVDYLYQLQWHGIKLGLGNIQQILKALSDPHQRYRTVHIAGTNGKGSTAALVAALLQAQGYRVGLYTSPHLVDFSERIRINGVPISHDHVAGLTEKILKLASASGGPDSRLALTFFEFTTAMAFLYFAESSVDLAVIEVGMGGRFDATNVVTPLVSVITNIDYDHQAYLGNSLTQIAFEKAGIIKTAVPAVTAVEDDEARGVISKVCQERGSHLYRLGQDFHIDGASEEFTYRGIRHQWPALSLKLLGRHQLKNAACALAVAEILSSASGGQGFELSETSIRKGLRSASWEGRLEPIETPEGLLIFLDGAHNLSGARVLRDFLLEVKAKRGGRLFLVLGIMRDKDIPAVLGELVPLADSVVLTRPDYHRAASLSDLEIAARPFDAPLTLRQRVSEAVEFAKSAAHPGDCILITGSLFTVGEARAHLFGLGTPSKVRG